MGAPPLWVVPLLASAVLPWGGCSGTSSHFLRYFHMASMEPGQELPHFTAAGFVDDELFASYSSDTKQYQPRTSWAEKNLDASYWAGQSRIGQSNEKLYRVDLVILKNRYNQSGGFHMIQYMSACELTKDGHKRGYLHFGYDGRDFLSLDKKTSTWTAGDAKAQMTKRKVDADRTMTQGRLYYLEEICIQWLQKFLAYRKETLRRTEPPTVKVTLKRGYEDTETLLCRAHGFYPKEIAVVWTKDGKAWIKDTFRGTVAPNSDGTYYTLSGVTIDRKDRRQYRCHVDHGGLLEPLDVAWEELSGE
ncbi:class I histocompatibility antigen, F10 alpha chain-like [Varanus komodoensis]|uniref:class I histocompatibility antigen, F10 alpha chain-like n=1 Tax=Varanus komodoensis TaxID=61221 RepID=UPI001CF7D384|nr:class I histocompatibility antigen, F10 alpha chain-like [Varanus komodoensis]